MTWALVAAGWVVLFPNMNACVEQARKIENAHCVPVVKLK